MDRFVVAVSVLLAGAMACSAQAGVRIVRTGATYETVQAAVTAALDGDTIEIDSGTYLSSQCNAAISKNNLTLRGVGATRPVLDARWTSTGGKAIWVISGTNTTVEFLEFRNCVVPDLNGAGIRQEGANLTVRNCHFHDNEDGILAGANANSDILIESCEFNHNGAGDGQSHNIYIGHVRTCTIRYCYFHHGWKGQEIKSRAQSSYILYNRITCEQDGYSNYELDFPNGGTTYVIGNVIHQGPRTTQYIILEYAAEGATNADQHFYVVNNTFVNTNSVGTFVWNAKSTGIGLVQNNIFQGPGTIVTGPGITTQVTNWVIPNASLAWASQYDYRLTAASAGAIDAGTALETGWDGFSLRPTLQYVHPCSYESRPVNGTIDIGAYEYVSPPANQAPYVEAGTDGFACLPRGTVNLDGTVDDDGQPTSAAVTATWSKVSGPGTVTFGNVHAADTTATFSASGTYVLQLQASDGLLATTDTVTVAVSPDQRFGGPITFQYGVMPDARYDGCQDTSLSAYAPNGNAGFSLDGNGIGVYGNTKRSLIQFDLQTIPSTATVTSARIRLLMNRVSVSRTVEAYQVLRPWARQAATWNQYYTDWPWTAAGCDGVDTDRAGAAAGSVEVTSGQVGTRVEIPLSVSLVQGWVSGTIANHGILLKATNETGGEMRFRPENDITRHGALTDRPQMVVEYAVTSVAPVVSAGSDQAITAPAATLDGTVSDDGLPNSPAGVAVTWSKVSGPGTVTFADAHAVDTSATFSANGTYVLQLLASNGGLETADTVTIIVDPSGNGSLCVLGDFSIHSLKPATSAYTGGGIAFVPGHSDAIGQDTLVINWREKDTIDTAKYNQVFQRITIPGSGGVPAVLATAVIRWDMLYDGTSTFGPNGAAELAFDAASNKLITIRNPGDGGTRFFWFPLFAGDVTLVAGQVGYSARNGDNTAAMPKAIVPSAEGVYTSFYSYSIAGISSWRKAAIDIDTGSGCGLAMADIPRNFLSGWWPDTAAYPYTVDGLNCEGGTGYGSNALLIRNYKNSARGNVQESHLYQVNSTLSTAALNSAVDLGNMVATTGNFASLVAYGIALDGQTAYVRYGGHNDASANNRILMLNVRTLGEPIVGDINGDGAVNVVDLLRLAGSWGVRSGQDDYDRRCDLNGDGGVDVVDLLTLADSWPE